ncbi:TPA: hypothetical protein G9F27_005819, partial [Salmonella enterica]|nr:hypothetical protein [Salmonella enterica]
MVADIAADNPAAFFFLSGEIKMNDDMFYFLVDNIRDEDKPIRINSGAFVTVKDALDTNSDELALKAILFINRYFNDSYIDCYHFKKSAKIREWESSAVTENKSIIRQKIKQLCDSGICNTMNNVQKTLIEALKAFYVHCTGKSVEESEKLAAVAGVYIIIHIDTYYSLHINHSRLLLNVRDRIIYEEFTRGTPVKKLIRLYNLSETHTYAII